MLLLRVLTSLVICGITRFVKWRQNSGGNDIVRKVINIENDERKHSDISLTGTVNVMIFLWFKPHIAKLVKTLINNIPIK